MAIVVQCFQCSTILELDDGFRGGVARCSNCGTLLKVPKEVGAIGAPSGQRNAATPQPRPRSASDPGISSGGFRSGSVSGRTTDTPVSSGAFSRSPRPRTPATPQPAGHTGSRFGVAAGGEQKQPPQKAKQPLLLLFVFVVGVIFCIAGFAIVHELLPKNTQIVAPYTPVNPTNGTVTNDNAQKFLGIPLVGNHILFAIDGSAVNADTFNLVVQNLEYAVKHSISSQHFRALIWNNESGVLVPAHAWVRRSSSTTIWEPLASYVPTGDSDPLKAIIRSSDVNPVDQIILVTAREDLTDQLIKQIDDLQIQLHIDAIAINTSSTVLAQIAYQHKGVYQQVSTVDLQNALGN